ncbi:MAG: universal stress protein [Rickettsiales bacterium]|nr:universal stress protein [Rickettsiales bacterium]
MQKKIVVCLDGSQYTDSILSLNRWVSEALSLPTMLLHVAEPHSEYVARPNLSGAIGLGAKTILLEELSASDEAHGKEEQEKGNRILKEAEDQLKSHSDMVTETLHVRGDFVETILEVKPETSLVILGKRGEHHDQDSKHLGSNVEDLIRTIKLPILVASKVVTVPIERYMLLCDNDKDTQQLIDFITSNNLLKNTECHLVLLHETNHKPFVDKLEATSANVELYPGESCSLDAIPDYIKDNNINLLVTRSYRHSRIYDFIFEGHTNKLLTKTRIPLLLL